MLSNYFSLFYHNDVYIEHKTAELSRSLLKILIAYGSKGKFFHMEEFASALEKLGVECRLVKDTDYSNGFPSKRIEDWFFGDKKFKKLIQDFSPDAVFVDRQIHFGLHTIKARLPLFVLLRGQIWSEYHYAKKTLYKKNPLFQFIMWFRHKNAEKCLEKSSIIFPICEYLNCVVNEHYPKKSTVVFYEGINSSHWNNVKGMNLLHPCVGLLQDANWWGKTKEMLILSEVLEKMPNVNFYWAGDGPYRERVLSALSKYSNFRWLGRLEYPEKVREYLSEIDIYALITGMDLAPLTLKEAQLMEKPVVATDVGGVKEMMIDGKTGFLVKEGDSSELLRYISKLLENDKLATEMGGKGRTFVVEAFSWEKIARNFLLEIEPYLNKN